MSEQMINHVNNWEKANKEQNNKSITAELEIYKEMVKTFEQRLNIDLSSHEKMIDSQMDDIIKEKLALKEKNTKEENVNHDKCEFEPINKELENKPNQTWGSNATDIPSSSSLIMTGIVRFRNDQIARIMGYGDYQLGNVVISSVYYVEGLDHNLFFVGQFYDADLEVAFQKNTCFIRNLEGDDLLSRSRDTNLYTISLNDMLKSSSICPLSKA
ncbi:hypothetical protein Tco_1100504 [Tanacetum coccineum]